MLGRIVMAMALLAGPGAAQTPQEVALAKATLGALQFRSFRVAREHCGYLGRLADGALVAAKPRVGDFYSCVTRWPHERIEVFASYHTHSTWHEDADSEVPSVQDVEGDMADGIDGYISTPGGRLWFVDGQSGAMRQICGVGCLPVDPGFRPEPPGSVPEAMTLDELRARHGE